MPSNETLKSRFDVIGGGISGLLAAKKAAEAGYEVHLHEESPARVGGKIESSYLPDGTVVNNGAEFIDTDQTAIRELCKELNVPLIPATDQAQEIFQIAGGGVMSDKNFYEALRPIQEKVIRDKMIVAANPSGSLAQQLDKMSLSEYLASLAAETAEQRSVFSKAWNAAKGLVSSGVVSDAAIANTLAHIYGSEGGQDPQKISALQYVNEAPAEVGKLLASDCAFRVQGGTASIIQALKADLESKGVQFHMGSKAKAVNRNANGTFNLAFEDGSTALSEQVTFALPMHALGAVQGLETLGFSKEDVAFLQGGQYTHSAKFTIKTRQPANEKDDTCLFSGDGFQAWRSSPDTMTFLVGGETLNQMKGGKLVDYCLDRYTQTKGVKTDNFFDKSQMVFRGPDTQKPCYASPGPGQTLAAQRFAAKADELAATGVSVVGTYMPRDIPGSASIGFMNCGVESVNRAASIMFDKTQAVAETVPNFAKRLLQERTQPQRPFGGLGQFN